MAIKSFNPYSPSRRFITVSAFEEITTDKPYRPLVEKLVRKAGRNNTGKMTVRHQGGGHKRQYRIIVGEGIVADAFSLREIRRGKIRLAERRISESNYVLKAEQIFRRMADFAGASMMSPQMLPVRIPSLTSAQVV